jgi:hypothetical protein
MAVTALAGFLLLLGEVGQGLKPTVSLSPWVPKKAPWSVIAVMIAGAGSTWGFHRHWQEQRRIHQIAEQKTACDSLRTRCLEKAPLMMKKVLRQGKETLLVTKDENCGGDLTLKQGYETCLVRVRNLQTEQERQQDEQQQRETALSSEKPFLSLPENKER